MKLKPDDRLLKNFLENSCTPAEAKEVLSWMLRKDGMQLFEKQFGDDVKQLESGNENFENPKVRTGYIYQKILNKINPAILSNPQPNIRLSAKQTLKIAATILIPLFVTFATIWYFVHKPAEKIIWQEVYVPKGEKLQVIFQDGTKAWLNSDTKLTYPINFVDNKREVKLEGEAYFIVNKNAGVPFLVDLDNLVIKVTGTSFNVKAYNEESRITATLDEGKITLLARHIDKLNEYKITPGQEVEYVKKSGQVQIRNSQIGQNSKWKYNKLVFNDTPLFEIVKILERWYNVKIVIVDQEIAKYSYTINFKDENIKGILLSLEKITPIQFQIKNQVIEIRKKKRYNISNHN